MPHSDRRYVSLAIHLQTTMPITVPAQRRGLKALHGTMPAEVQTFFWDLPALIDSDFSLNIALAYAFFRIEQGQRQALYCGARKLHRTESSLTWKAIDLHDLTREGFKELFRTIYGFPVSTDAAECLASAQSVRDDLMHGRNPNEANQREALCNAMHYAREMNDLIADSKNLGFRPFSGDLRGIVGALQPLDKSTTRWILKGMGFSFG